MTKTLYRTEKDKMIGGVCGGLGKYFDIDPTLIRLFFALIFFGYGAGLMIYGLLWIVMPNERMLEAQDIVAKEETESKEDEDDAIEPDEIIDA
ncbi:MAG: PspC domain-containing protein [Anaerolineae bacterium]|jgi:phage shock protein C|nr:PspC domain-containing protein [Anaerolineae bacterium]MBT7074549.1 PspC domain-containing protein [Anaerolineae bacterium]MBT7782708.1 PspC domain-containing protein [Anaerolineae bacterium]